MQFSDALEVAIGLSFIFLLLSLVMTALQEAVESVSRQRGKRLIQGFEELLSDPARRAAAVDVVRAIYEHPQIHSLYRGDFDGAKAKNQLPSYIPSRNFALALIDQVLAFRLDAADTHGASLSPSATPAERLRLAAERIQSEPLRKAILQAVDMAAGDMEKVQKNLEAWFDSGMDRVSGWYRRQTHHFMFVVGLVLSVALNINALVIADGLAQNATLRRAVAAGAESYTQTHTAPAPKAAEPAASTPPPVPPSAATPAPGVAPAPAAPPVTPPAAAPDTGRGRVPEEAVGIIQNLGLPIGWGATGRSSIVRMASYHGTEPWAPVAHFGIWLTLGFGWLMTALAVTLGAPFWFDLLNKLVVIRATVKPHEKSREEGSQDHQDKKGVNVTVSAPAAPKPVAPVGPQIEDHDPVVDQLHPADRPREGDEHEAVAA